MGNHLKHLIKVKKKLEDDEKELFRKNVENEISKEQYEKELEDNSYNQIEINREITEIKNQKRGN